MVVELELNVLGFIICNIGWNILCDDGHVFL